MAQRDLIYLLIIALLGVGCVYVAARKDTLNVFSCPIRLVNGFYRSAIANEPICIGTACPPVTEQIPGVSIYTDTVGLGAAAVLRTSQLFPREAELVNNSQVLLSVANSSIIIGDTRPTLVEPGKIYISGRGVRDTIDPQDFVTVRSETTLVSPDNTLLKLQFVAYKLGGGAGIRLMDPANPDRTTTILSGGQIPRWVLGRPAAATVYDNPDETIILPSGPVTQNAIACVDAPFTTGQITLSISFNPPPASCYRQMTGISTTTLIELSASTGTTCAASAAVISAAETAFDLLDFPDVCFSPGACDPVLRADNITTISGTQHNLRTGAVGPTVLLNIGCTSNRVLIICRQTRQ
jgi:hypothetical protein